MKDLKWSIFSRWYRGKSSDCVYNSLDASYVLFPDRIERFEPGSDFLSQGIDAKMIDILISKDILCEKSRNEEDVFVTLAHNECQICNLNVLVTEKCNLMCSYCQITNNTESTNSMTKETAKKVLDRFFSAIAKGSKSTVNITGGEPLLNWYTVKYIIEYCRTYHSSCRVVMFTNAMLMTSEIAKYLAENGVFVIISFDGPKFIHDCNRRNGEKGSYDQSFDGYTLAKQAGCKCAISAVANEYSLFNTSAFADWVMSMKPDSLGFNYPHLLLSSPGDAFDFSQYAKAVIYLHKEMQNNNIYFENFERFKKVILERKIRLNECQACGKGMTVRPDGKVGPCKSLLVSGLECYLLDEYNFDTNNMLGKWAKRKTIIDERCRTCEALSICGGGCAYDSFIINKGDISKMDYRMCDYVKIVFNHIMEDICDNKIINYSEEVQSVGH